MSRNDRRKRLREWAHQHAILRDNGSIPHDIQDELNDTIKDESAIGAEALDEVAYEMKVFLHGAKMAPPVAPGWLAQIEKWHARLTRERNGQ